MFSRITVVNKSGELIERFLAKLISGMDLFNDVVKIGFYYFFFLIQTNNTYPSAGFIMPSKYALHSGTGLGINLLYKL